MKAHTIAFKEGIKKFGRELDSVITYELNGETIELGNNNLNSISPHFEGSILKSVMKVLDIDSNEDIPLETEINYRFGVKVRNDEVEDYRDNYDYIDFGNYIVYKSEKQEDTNSYKITCYDKLLYSMKDYESLGLTYPITIRDYINAICQHLGLTFANISDTFANYDKTIPNELYIADDNASLGYTFRDVLDELAEVTASTICINDDDELEIRYITETNDTIDEEYLKDTNVNFGEQFGPINTIVLSRSAGADNIYYPPILPENPVELKISDNQIMNNNNRVEFMPDIYAKLNGLQYIINDFNSIGVCYYDLCDRYSVSIGENTYSCVMFNDDINITDGLEESIYTELPKESVTDYTKADTTDRKINQTQLIVDKQQGIIEALVNNTTYVSDTKTGIGSIQLENAHEGELYKLSIKGQISLLFPQSQKEYGYSLVPNESLVPNNELVPSNPMPYENDIHYPSSDLFTKSQNLLIDDTKYKLDFDFLNYMSEEVCDEFVYENGTCYIIRRVGIDSEGDMYALDNEVIEPRKGIILNVKSNSTISLQSFSSAMLTATYLLQNIYTDNFATEVEVQTLRTQTENSITELATAKVGDDEIIAKLNLAIEDGQGIIDIVGNQVTIRSDHFELDADGDIRATNAELNNAQIINGQIHITQQASDLHYPIILDQTSANDITYRNTIGSGYLYLRNLTEDKIYARLSGGSLGYGLFSLYNSNGDATITENGSNSSIQIYDNSGNKLVTINELTITPPAGNINVYNINDNGNTEIIGDSIILSNSNGVTTIDIIGSNGNIYANNFVPNSRESIKKNIKPYNNALKEVLNTDIYKYNLKTENDEDKKHIGFVIGENRKYSKDITAIRDEEETGADLYSMVSVLWQAVKEQQEIIEDLSKRIEKLERESDK